PGAEEARGDPRLVEQGRVRPGAQPFNARGALERPQGVRQRAHDRGVGGDVARTLTRLEPYLGGEPRPPRPRLPPRRPTRRERCGARSGARTGPDRSTTRPLPRPSTRAATRDPG